MYNKKGGMTVADIMQYKCPRCDGAVEFNTETQNIKCPYCGTEFDIDSMSSTVSEEESVCDATPRKELEADGFLKYICKVQAKTSLWIYFPFIFPQKRVQTSHQFLSLVFLQ